MATTSVAGYAFPQFDDYDDPQNFAFHLGQSNLSDFVEYGLSITPDHTNENFDLGEGKAYVEQASAVGDASAETRHRLNYGVHVDATADIAFATTTGVNYVWIDANVGTQDSPQIVVETNDTAPSDASLKIATIDAANDTHSEVNREPDASFHSVTTTGKTPLSTQFTGYHAIEMEDAETGGARGQIGMGLYGFEFKTDANDGAGYTTRLVLDDDAGEVQVQNSNLNVGGYRVLLTDIELRQQGLYLQDGYGKVETYGGGDGTFEIYDGANSKRIMSFQEGATGRAEVNKSIFHVIGDKPASRMRIGTTNTYNEIWSEDGGAGAKRLVLDGDKWARLSAGGGANDYVGIRRSGYGAYIVVGGTAVMDIDSNGNMTLLGSLSENGSPNAG